MANRHALPMFCGFVGLACLFSPFFMDMPAKFVLWKRSQEVAIETGSSQIDVKATEEVERAKIQERAATSQAARKSGVNRPGRTMKMAAYIYDPNNLPQISTRGYLPTDTIYIYDATGFCFAKHENRQIKFLKDYPSICN
jgi:hypothetical protein